MEIRNVLFDIKHWMAILLEYSIGQVNRERNHVVCILFFFLTAKRLQTHIDSVNQSGNSESMCTPKDGCCRALRAKLSALVFSVLGT